MEGSAAPSALISRAFEMAGRPHLHKQGVRLTHVVLKRTLKYDGISWRLNQDVCKEANHQTFVQDFAFFPCFFNQSTDDVSWLPPFSCFNPSGATRTRNVAGFRKHWSFGWSMNLLCTSCVILNPQLKCVCVWNAGWCAGDDEGDAASPAEASETV